MEIRGLKAQADEHCLSVIKDWKAHCAMISAQILPSAPPVLALSLQPGVSSQQLAPLALVPGSSSPMAIDPPAAKRKAANTLQEEVDAEETQVKKVAGLGEPRGDAAAEAL